MKKIVVNNYLMVFVNIRLIFLKISHIKKSKYTLFFVINKQSIYLARVDKSIQKFYTQIMKYKAIFSDFDGTLYRNDHTISQANKTAIEDYVNAGGKFIIATGRLYSAIKHHLSDLGLHGEVITTQGAEIYDIATGKQLYAQYLEIDEAMKALQYCEMNDLASPMVYVDNKCYSQFCNEWTKIFAKITGLDLIYTDCKLSEYILLNNFLPSKVLAMIDDNKIDDFIKNGQQKLGEKYDICKSQDFLVEILKSGVNKGTAVKRLCEQYDIGLHEIICLGDSENDIAMLKIAGLGVAVGNAYEHVKQVANYVCESNDDDGVAKTIERFCK